MNLGKFGEVRRCPKCATIKPLAAFASPSDAICAECTAALVAKREAIDLNATDDELARDPDARGRRIDLGLEILTILRGARDPEAEQELEELLEAAAVESAAAGTVDVAAVAAISEIREALRSGQPLTLDQIAAFCGVSSHTIRNIEREALKKLRGRMAEIMGEEQWKACLAGYKSGPAAMLL